MSMSIRTNVSSLNAQRNLFSTQMSLDSSLSKLSSGYRIAKAGDDAAGNGVAANLNAHIVSYAQAIKNAQDGLALVQTAESGMSEIESMVTRLRELAMQAASDGVSNTERAYINTEATGINTEITRIANATEYNGNNVLLGTTRTFQIGIRASANDQLNVVTSSTTAATLGTNGISLTTQANAVTALGLADAALNTLSSNRATVAVNGESLNHAIATLQSTYTNVSEAYSRIKDVDVAEESSRLTRNQILLQAGVSTLAQANQIPQLALKLLG